MIMKTLSRDEMKMVMGGDEAMLDNPDGGGPCDGKSPGDSCTFSDGPCKGSTGKCSSKGSCAGAC